MYNPQQQDNQFNYPSNKNEGVKSVVKKFKSNSQIIIYSDWFSRLVNQNQINIKSQVYYPGNASDLWGLLLFEIKSLNTVLNENFGQLSLYRKTIQAGQLFMFYQACSKIKNYKIQLLFKDTYIAKITKFRQQLQKQRTAPSKINSNDSTIGSYIQNLNLLSSNRLIQLNHMQFQFDNLNEQNQKSITNKLRQTLNQLIVVSKNYFKQEKLNKIKIRVVFLCLLLTFVLDHIDWKKLCFSQFMISDHLIKYLSEKNGAMIIAKFLHDASPQILYKSLKKFSQAAFHK